ncbi:hypothetical protein VNO77_34335 [Canavalia gladiata]|uniref:Uncharacterized protein n=1 Tax=Canavalia gladiata TaxID=3824 RepID=A0AAN9KE50_CANGL
MGLAAVVIASNRDELPYRNLHGIHEVECRRHHRDCYIFVDADEYMADQEYSKCSRIRIDLASSFFPSICLLGLRTINLHQGPRMVSKWSHSQALSRL